MPDSAQLSPVSQVLASLGLTRDDLLRHADSMREFLAASKEDEAATRALPPPPQPIPEQPSPSPASALTRRRLSSPREPMTPARKSGSMEEILERKRAQSRRERRSKRERDREDKTARLASSDVQGISSTSSHRNESTDLTPQQRKYYRTTYERSAPHASSPLPASSPPFPTSSPMSSPVKGAHRVAVSSPGPYGSPSEDASDLPYTLPPGPYSSAKPAYSYAALIGRAVLASPDHALTLQDIYSFMVTVFPHFSRSEPTWQNSVRHVLSTTAVFRKTPRPRKEGRTLWAIWDDDLPCFEDGGFKKERCKDMVFEAAPKKPGLKRAATMIEKVPGTARLDMPSSKRTKSNPVNASASSSTLKIDNAALDLYQQGGKKQSTSRLPNHPLSQPHGWSKIGTSPEFRFPSLPSGHSTIASMESSSSKSTARPWLFKSTRVNSSRSSSTSGGPSSRYTLSSASFPSSSSQGPDDEYESEEGDEDCTAEFPPSSRIGEDENEDVFSGPSSPIKVQSQYRIPPVPQLIANEEGDSSSSPCLLGSDEDDEMKLSYPENHERNQTEAVDQLAVDVHDITAIAGDASEPEYTTDGAATETEDGAESDAISTSTRVVSGSYEGDEETMDPETESRLFDEVFQSDALGAGFSPKTSPKRQRTSMTALPWTARSNKDRELEGPKTPSRSRTLSHTSPSRTPLSLRSLHRISSPGFPHYTHRPHHTVQSAMASGAIFPPRTPGTPRRLLFPSSSAHSPFRDYDVLEQGSLLDELSRASPSVGAGLFERTGLLYESPGSSKRRDSHENKYW